MKRATMKISKFCKGLNLLDLLDFDKKDCTGYLLSIEEGDEEKDLLTLHLFYYDYAPFVFVKLDLYEMQNAEVSLGKETDIDKMLFHVLHSEQINFFIALNKIIELNSHAKYEYIQLAYDGKDFVENKISVKIYFKFDRELVK